MTTNETEGNKVDRKEVDQLKGKYVVVREFHTDRNRILDVFDNEKESIEFYESVLKQSENQEGLKKGCLVLYHLSDDILVFSPSMELDYNYRYELLCNCYDCYDKNDNRVFIPVEDDCVLKIDQIK